MRNINGLKLSDALEDFSKTSQCLGSKMHNFLKKIMALKSVIIKLKYRSLHV